MVCSKRVFVKVTTDGWSQAKDRNRAATASDVGNVPVRLKPNPRDSNSRRGRFIVEESSFLGGYEAEQAGNCQLRGDLFRIPGKMISDFRAVICTGPCPSTGAQLNITQ